MYVIILILSHYVIIVTIKTDNHHDSNDYSGTVRFVERQQQSELLKEESAGRLYQPSKSDLRLGIDVEYLSGSQ